MRSAYFHCVGGASGDMILGAVIDAGVSVDELYVARITADEGPTLKRGRAGARGRYKPLLKRSSHITVVVADRD